LKVHLKNSVASHSRPNDFFFPPYSNLISRTHAAWYSEEEEEEEGEKEKVYSSLGAFFT